MLDRWICRKANDDFKGDYDPEWAIASTSYENPGKKQLNVIFPPWHGGGRVIDLLGRRLAIGSSVLRYEFHDRILEPDIENVQMSFNKIAGRVSDDLDHITAKSNYEKVHLVGLSLGNVALAKTARMFDDFDTVTMVTAATILSDAMWEGARTQNIRQVFEEQGVTQRQLRVAWHDLAPLTHVKVFREKQVHTVVSRSDTIIPAYLQSQMSDRLRMAGANVKETIKPLGHVATLTSFCIKG